jgi:predicted nucleotidyltransferase
MIKARSLTKLIAVLTLTVFTYSFIIHEPLYGAVELVKENSEAAKLRSTQNQFFIPHQLGRVTDGKLLNKDKLIVYIQDLHCNPEVQNNIFKLINFFQTKAGISNIFVEGAPRGKVDLSSLSSIPDEKIKWKALDSLFSKGLLTGAEYYCLKSSAAASKLSGLENWDTYLDNLARYRNIYAEQNLYVGRISALKLSIDDLRSKYLSPDLKKLERAFNSRERNEKYYFHLVRLGDKFNEPITRYPNLWRYVQMLRLNNDIRFKSLNKELKAYVSELKNILPFKAYNELMDKIRDDESSDEYYYSLAKISREYSQGLSQRYPQALKFFDYLALTYQINPIYLLEEENIFKQRLLEKRAERMLDKDIVFLIRMSEGLGDYVKLSMNPEQFRFFSTNRGRFKALLQKYFAFSDVEEVITLLDDEELAKFYETNFARSDIFLHSLSFSAPIPDHLPPSSKARDSSFGDVLQNIRGFKEIDVVIAGGFHFEISKLLKKEDVSYLSITPNVTKKVDNTLYEQVITGNADLAKIFSSALAPALTALGIDLNSFCASVDSVFQAALASDNFEQRFGDLSAWANKQNEKVSVEQATDKKGVTTLRFYYERKDNDHLLFSITQKGGKVKVVNGAYLLNMKSGREGKIKAENAQGPAIQPTFYVKPTGQQSQALGLLTKKDLTASDWQLISRFLASNDFVVQLAALHIIEYSRQNVPEALLAAVKTLASLEVKRFAVTYKKTVKIAAIKALGNMGGSKGVKEMIDDALAAAAGSSDLDIIDALCASKIKLSLSGLSKNEALERLRTMLEARGQQAGYMEEFKSKAGAILVRALLEGGSASEALKRLEDLSKGDNAILREEAGSILKDFSDKYYDSYFNEKIDERWLKTNTPWLATSHNEDIIKFANLISVFSRSLSAKFSEDFIGISIVGSAAKGYFVPESDFDLNFIFANTSKVSAAEKKYVITELYKKFARENGLPPKKVEDIHFVSLAAQMERNERLSELFGGIFVGDRKKLENSQREIYSKLTPGDWDELRNDTLRYESDMKKGFTRFGILDEEKLNKFVLFAALSRVLPPYEQVGKEFIGDKHLAKTALEPEKEKTGQGSLGKGVLLWDGAREWINRNFGALGLMVYENVIGPILEELAFTGIPALIGFQSGNIGLGIASLIISRIIFVILHLRAPPKQVLRSFLLGGWRAGFKALGATPKKLAVPIIVSVISVIFFSIFAVSPVSAGPIISFLSNFPIHQPIFAIFGIIAVATTFIAMVGHILSNTGTDIVKFVFGVDFSKAIFPAFNTDEMKKEQDKFFASCKETEKKVDELREFITQDKGEVIVSDGVISLLSSFENTVTRENPFSRVQRYWPLLKSIVQLDKNEEQALIEKLHSVYDIEINGKKQKHSELIDAIFFIHEIRTRQTPTWLEEQAPNLQGRRYYAVSAEVSEWAGGLGPVMVYNILGMMQLGMDVISVEPGYQLTRSKGNPKGDKLDYSKLDNDYLTVRNLKEDYDEFEMDLGFNPDGTTKKVKVRVGRGISKTPGGDVNKYLIRDVQEDGSSYYTRMLYNYGQPENPVQWFEFSAFFSKASAMFIAREEARQKSQQEKEGVEYKSAIVHSNDAQTGMVSAILKSGFPHNDEFKNNPYIQSVIKDILCVFTTHTIFNREEKDDNLLHHTEYVLPIMCDISNKFISLYKRIAGGKVIFDYTSGNLHCADVTICVSDDHLRVISPTDPRVQTNSVTNGALPQMISDEFRKAVKRALGRMPHFYDPDFNRLSAFEIEIGKEESKKNLGGLGIKTANGFDLEIDPTHQAVGSCRRLVREKVGRGALTDKQLQDELRRLCNSGETFDKNDPRYKALFEQVNRAISAGVAFSDDIIWKLVENGVDVILFAPVQGAGTSEDIAEELKLLERKIRAAKDKELRENGKLTKYTGNFSFVSSYTPQQKIALLAALDIQVQDSWPNTGAAEFSEEDISANYGLEFSPWVPVGVIMEQGLPIDWKRPGRGNTIIPKGPTKENYWEEFQEAINLWNKIDPKTKMRTDFYKNCTVGGRLDRIQNYQISSSADLRLVSETLERKKLDKEVDGRLIDLIENDLKYDSDFMNALLSGDIDFWFNGWKANGALKGFINKKMDDEGKYGLDVHFEHLFQIEKDKNGKEIYVIEKSHYANYISTLFAGRKSHDNVREWFKNLSDSPENIIEKNERINNLLDTLTKRIEKRSAQLNEIHTKYEKVFEKVNESVRVNPRTIDELLIWGRNDVRPFRFNEKDVADLAGLRAFREKKFEGSHKEGPGYSLFHFPYGNYKKYLLGLFEGMECKSAVRSFFDDLDQSALTDAEKNEIFNYVLVKIISDLEKAKIGISRPTSILNEWVKKHFPEGTPAYKAITILGAPGWEAPVFAGGSSLLAGFAGGLSTLPGIGAFLFFSVVVFAAAHVIVNWIVTKNKPKLGDLKYLVPAFIFTAAYVMPFTVLSAVFPIAPINAALLSLLASYSVHAIYNALVLNDRIPAWAKNFLPVGSIFNKKAALTDAELKTEKELYRAGAEIGRYF